MHWKMRSRDGTGLAGIQAIKKLHLPRVRSWDSWQENPSVSAVDRPHLFLCVSRDEEAPASGFAILSRLLFHGFFFFQDIGLTTVHYEPE